MADACSVLPLDCWELILERVDNLEAISLVCKDFLLISNDLHDFLVVYSSSIEILNRILKRFRCLKEIDLSNFNGDMNLAVLEIAKSGLDIKALNVSYHDKLPVESFVEVGSCMKSLKRLECYNISSLDDDDLIAVATSIPWLEEIDISKHWGSITDAGIKMLAKRLENLQFIDISGNCGLSSRSVLYLSSNCPLLRTIKAWNCTFQDQDCVAQLFRHCSNLVSFCITNIYKDSHDSSPSLCTFENSIAYAKNLSELDISGPFVTDSILSAIMNAPLPLKKLGLRQCRNFSAQGLAMLLRAYPSLEELDLEKSELHDNDMDGLFQYLKNIAYINLRSSKAMTRSTFFNLIRNCPLLVEINMSNTRLDAEEGNLCVDLIKNHHIQNLILSDNTHLKDDILIRICHSCPNLQFLDVTRSWHITKDGVREILKSCKKLKHLAVNICKGTKTFGTDLQYSELNIEVLEISGINDEDMAMMAKICPRLWKLILRDKLKLEEVTNKGVMVLVENCKKLWEINLRSCCNVTVDILPLMVSCRPTLKRIVPPYTCKDFVPSEEHKDLFVPHKKPDPYNW